MSVAGFSRHKHLDELDEPLQTGEGWLTAAQRRARVVANLGITATAAELNYLDLTTIGEAEAEKAIVLDSDGNLDWSLTYSGTGNIEPFIVNSTLTGAGATGGRARFELDTNVALGGWANALKAQTEFGASGSVTGLGSAFVAEMVMSAGTAAGTYAPLEIELGMPSGAVTGTKTSLIHANVYGADASTFDENGYLMSLNGLTAGATDLFQTGGTAANVAGSLKIDIGGTDYFIVVYDGQVTA